MAIKLYKKLDSLPTTLEPNSIYAIKVSLGFDLYISNNVGDVAYKLNSINSIELLNLLKTVDGSGSGLDADLFDGLESNYFSLANFNEETITAKKDLTFSDAKYQLISSTTNQIINLPDPATSKNKEFLIINKGTSILEIQIEDTSTNTFLNPDESLLFYCTEINWEKVQLSSSTSSGGGSALQLEYKIADFTSNPNTINAVDTLSNPVIATLPNNPPNGTIVSFYDFNSSFNTNSLTINSGIDNTILDVTELILNTANSTVQLIFYGTKWSLLGTEVFLDRASTGGGVSVIPIATTSQAGIAELATNTEVMDSLIGDKIVTPSTLNYWKNNSNLSSTLPSATTTVEGIVKLVTDSDALDINNNTDVITPYSLNIVLGDKGYLDTLPSASDTLEGIIRLATPTEVLDGIADNIAISPATLPLADVDKKGIAFIASEQDVLDEISNNKIVTPATLKKWRIENNITSNLVTSTSLYVSQSNYHSLSGTLRNTDPNHGDSVTYTQYLANQNNPANDGNYWQLFDPEGNNFRCLKTLKDVADYGNDNYSPDDILILYMDSGKYRCDYTFNFGITINGVNNTGSLNWGNPDYSDTQGIILYTTSDYQLLRAASGIRYYSNSMTINSNSKSSLKYVHFWSWVTAVKDSTLAWGNIKKVGENTVEQHWLNIDEDAFTTSPDLCRSKYNGSNLGIGNYNPLIILKGSGDKILNYCSFSGIGTSAPKVNINSYKGGYISVLNDCLLSLIGIIFRGNEEIRVSDKRGRKITTPLSTTPLMLPPDLTERGNDTLWTFEPIYTTLGDFDSDCIGNFGMDGVFHDPYTEEWVTIGFCDVFLGIGSNVQLRLELSESFSTNLSLFGSNQPALFSSIDPESSFTINHDLKNIRIETNHGKLFGLVDDRVINSQTSVSLSDPFKYRFRGTDTLGKKISNLYPPELTFIAGEVENKTNPVNPERDAFNSWVNAFKSQGSSIRNFIYSKYNCSISIDGEFSLWGDRDCSGLITGQGFIGEFGYLLQPVNIKLQPIQAHDFLSVNSPYGRALVFNESCVGSQLILSDQYQYNLFRSVWKGFNDVFTYPVIIDLSTNYSTYLADIELNPPDFSSISTLLLSLGYTLNGSNIGARFIFVGVNDTEKFSLMFTGYEGSNYYFLRFGDSSIGVTEYFQATKIDNISDLSSLTGTPTLLYIKDSNLFLENKNYTGDITNIINWQPYFLNLDKLTIYNAFHLGLMSNTYLLGFHVDKYGINITHENNSYINETQINKSISLLYTQSGYPNNLNISSDEYNVLLALFSSGFLCKTKIKGLFVISFSSNEIIA